MTAEREVPDGAIPTRELADKAGAWPFVEARGLAQKLSGQARADDKPILFETGYGPSGLPHVGTFGEVVRTTMVRNAFAALTGKPTRLLAFSDDMDALRSVPDNVPNRDLLAANLGLPLTSVPDPFGRYESFGHHNNAMLRGFLDRFGFDYEFASSTEYYKSGRFDATLLKVLERYDEVVKIMLPTLGPERRATYSPFLPVCAKTGQVLQARVVHTDVGAGTVVYEEEEGELGSRRPSPVAGASCSGSRTGRCAGRRWGWITRWPART